MSGLVRHLTENTEALIVKRMRGYGCLCNQGDTMTHRYEVSKLGEQEALVAHLRSILAQ